MAQRTQIILIDDVDGSPADESLTFGLDGVHYEIDLSAAHATKLREGLASWLEHGRRVRDHRRASSSATTKRTDLDAIRAWGRQNGHKVSDRGRVSRALQEAYDADQR